MHAFSRRQRIIRGTRFNSSTELSAGGVQRYGKGSMDLAGVAGTLPLGFSYTFFATIFIL